MQKINIKNISLQKGYPIEIAGDGKSITTGMKAPVGIHANCAKNINVAATYNMYGAYLDKIIKKKQANAVVFNDNTVYCEVVENMHKYVMTFDGSTLMCEGNKNDKIILFPVMFYILSDLSGCDESKEYFKLLKEEFDESGFISQNNVALFCDAMYHEPLQTRTIANDEIILQEGVSIKPSFEQAVRKQSFSYISLISDLKLPDIIPNTGTTSTVSEDVFEQAKKGEMLINYDFKYKEFAQPISYLDEYVPNSTYRKTLNKITYRLNKVLERMNSGKSGIDAIKNDYINFTLCGSPGTGKTVTAYALSASTGLPIMTINQSKHTEEDKYEGETKVINGKITSIESDFYKIYSSGGIILLEEFNLCDPGVIMGAIGQAIEFPFIFKKYGYETVRRHPLCVIISTMNTGTAGSKKVNEAFSSRNKQTYILDVPNKNEFVDILMKKGFERKNCNKIYDVYSRVISYLTSPTVNEPDMCMNVTLRSCIGALESMEEGETVKEAVCSSIIGKIAENDIKLANETLAAISAYTTM